MRGLRLALSWLTVLPVGVPRVDPATARTAIALAPLIGLPLGGAALGLLSLLDLIGAPGLLAGLLTVGLLAVLTRAMHLDGLADTADGFGCYGPPERALTVMRDGGAGPFAVVTLIVVVGTQAVALGSLVPSGRWFAVPLALVAGRAAFSLCCVRGVPAARPEGLGALVAGSQPAGAPVAWWLTLILLSVPATPDRPWLAALSVVVAAGAVLLLVLRARKRFGGITGDVLGAACEVATTIVLIGCTLH
ncbi:MAG TPA: adenosylcobinamide-GDP ribazoletransferase [Actinophytocola sp.]|uniref:adenosylcobinamide-GDP ribazoletransferase n=1 Tax=Actinophytocola sp. TaxID=1872138 RepID=UPI002E0CC38E|nr:adenosylcobinamide-GDP ribazoletransferase [Actinophytocola sp.]